MTKLLTLSLLAASILAPLTASADDFYAGASAASGGQLTFENNGKSNSTDGRPQLRLYGGWSFADGLALEGGYSQSGTARFDKNALGTANDPTFKISTFTMAGHWEHRFSDAWSISGKAGLARNRFSLSGGNGEHDRLTTIRPLLSVGVAYNVSKSIALTIDLEHIARTRKQGLNIEQNNLQFGVRVGF